MAAGNFTVSASWIPRLVMAASGVLALAVAGGELPVVARGVRPAALAPAADCFAGCVRFMAVAEGGACLIGLLLAVASVVADDGPLAAASSVAERWDSVRGPRRGEGLASVLPGWFWPAWWKMRHAAATTKAAASR